MNKSIYHGFKHSQILIILPGKSELFNEGGNYIMDGKEFHVTMLTFPYIFIFEAKEFHVTMLNFS